MRLHDLGTWLRSVILGPFNLKDSNSQLQRLLGGHGPVSSGEVVTEWTALNVSAVWAAVQLIAGSLAALPLILYRRSGADTKDRFITHPLYELMHDQPNPEMTSMVFRETLQGHVLTWGNGYAEIQRDNAERPLALWPLTPDRVTPFRTPDGTLRYRIAAAGGDRVTPAELDAEDVFHVPGLGFDGLCGYSVIRRAREALGLALATERFGAQFFGNGSRPGGVLQHKGRLTADAHERLRNDWEAHYSGPNRHRPAILEEGMTWQTIGVPPDDAQFLVTRAFQITEIARWFNVPPHKLRDLSRATFSNVESQAIEFVTDTLTPWMIRWEQELNRKLIRPLERRSQFFKHNANALLRGDVQSRFTAYGMARQWGWMSVNDIRALEDENPIGPKGDVYLEPVNMIPAAPATSRPEPSVPQPPPPPAAPGEPVPAGRDIARLIEATITDTVRELLPAALPAPAPEPIAIDRILIEIRREVTATMSDRDDQIARRLEEWAGRLTAELRPPLPALEVPTPLPAAVEVAPVPARASSAVIAGHRAAVEDCVGRMIRRETGRARRVKSPEALISWIGPFYTRHASAFELALRPFVETHLGLVGSGERSAEEVARDLVARHVAQSRSELQALLDGDRAAFPKRLDALLTRWEIDRPGLIPDTLMREEIDHAA